ncbi:MAG: hypothetical protein Q8861_08980 [Bacteroidota bacterium]|nr:hypothetical protein [Bacteroidota bacterium]
MNLTIFIKQPINYMIFNYKTLFCALILFLFTTQAFAAKPVYESQQDETVCRQIVVDFYKWYSQKLSSNNASEFQPKFAQDENGYTTLDFTAYVKNLKRMKCSDSFISREIESYEPCIENLKKIKYREVEDKLPDLSDYENIKCDFFNIHRWTMSMENFSGVEIKKTTVQKDKSVVCGIIYEDTPDKKYYYGTVVVTLLKIGNIWMIDDIKI